MPAPDSYFLEVEFTPGVWTDVTAYMDGGLGSSITYGRATEYGAPQAASLNVMLENTDGRFTPQRQTLKDLTTAHPYYPNVVPRRRIRWGYVKAATRYVRFTGYIRGWPPNVINDGTYEQVAVTATDRSLQLQRLKMLATMRQEVDALVVTLAAAHVSLANFHYWPINDDAGAAAAVDAYGGTSLTSPTGGANLPTFGVDGPDVGNGTAASFASASGQSLAIGVGAGIPWWGQGSFAAWVKPSAIGSTMTALGIDDPTNTIGFELRLTASLHPEVTHGGVTLTAATAIPNGQWAHLGVTLDAGVMTLWVNGASAGTAAIVNLSSAYKAETRVGRPGKTLGNYFNGSIGHVIVSGSGGWLMTATDAARFYAAGLSGRGETVDERLARWLRYAGLTASDWNLDASTVTLATYDQATKTPFDAGQEIMDSEGGGAALYVDTDDRVRFVNRDNMKPAVPVLILDAEADLDGTWEPAYDADTLVNSSVGSQASISGVSSTYPASDADSISEFGQESNDFTSYAQDGADVLGNAQARVAAGRVPGFRLIRVTVDLVTAQNDLWADAAAVRIGSRIRISNLPAGAAPTAQLDLIVQGWSDAYTVDGGYVITFDTIPADIPAWLIWDTSVTLNGVVDAYSRWAAGDFVVITPLGGGIGAGDTTIVVFNSNINDPGFTTDPTVYPLVIKVDEEHIRLNSAPTLLSPGNQQFAGVTRGVDGTPAVAHAASAPMTLVPSSTWTL